MASGFIGDQPDDARINSTGASPLIDTGGRGSIVLAIVGVCLRRARCSRGSKVGFDHADPGPGGGGAVGLYQPKHPLALVPGGLPAPRQSSIAW
jgi:hypothetical protein